MKKMSVKSFMMVNCKKCDYILTRTSRKTIVFFECKAAGIAQNFESGDIPALLLDLPELIIEEKEYEKKHDNVIRFRVSEMDKKNIEKKAVKSGFSSVSRYLRALALKA